MINELIKNIKIMIEAIGEEATEESINTIFYDCTIDSVKELNDSIECELSYMADASN